MKGNNSPQGIGLKALLPARFDLSREDDETTEFIVDFISWISKSDFLRLQQPEPTVGDREASYPAAVDTYGIKGQSVYTALFHHLDMETFTCKLCGHTVMDSLEDAIIHQRAVHFAHYPDPDRTN